MGILFWEAFEYKCKDLKQKNEMMEVKSILRDCWPKLHAATENVQDDIKAKKKVIKAIRGNKKYNKNRLKIKFAQIIDFGNKINDWKVEIPACNVLPKQKALHTAHNFAGEKVISYLDKSLLNEMTKRKEKNNDSEMYWIGLATYSIIRESRISKISLLKKILTSEIDLGTYENNRLFVVITIGKENESRRKRKVEIGLVTQLLLLQIHKLYRKTSSKICLFNESINTGKILECLRDAIVFPNTKGANITISRILEWAKYSNVVHGLPSLYANYTSDENISPSIIKRNLLRKNTSKLKKINYEAISEYSEVRTDLKDFTKFAGSNSNEFKRVTYSVAEKKLNEIMNKYTDEDKKSKFELIICEYVLFKIGERRNKKNKVANMAPLAKLATELLNFYEKLNKIDEPDIISLCNISEEKLVDLYNASLDLYADDYIKKKLNKLISFHNWAAKLGYLQDMDFTCLDAYYKKNVTGVRPVMVTPSEYSFIKSNIKSSSFVIDNRHGSILEVMIIIATRCGLRRFELTNLTLYDIQLAIPSFYIRRHNQNTKTSNAKRKINIELLTNDEIKILTYWYELRSSEISSKDKDAWLFTKNSEDEKPISYYYSTDIISKILKKSLDCDEATIHWLRHTCANWLWLCLEIQIYPEIKYLIDGFDSHEFFDEYQKRCAKILLGYNPIDRFDAWKGAYSLAIIMGHSHPGISFYYYVHVFDIILSAIPCHNFNLTNDNVEFLLDIGKTQRNKIFPPCDDDRYSYDKLIKYTEKKYKSFTAVPLTFTASPVD